LQKVAAGSYRLMLCIKSLVAGKMEMLTLILMRLTLEEEAAKQVGNILSKTLAKSSVDCDKPSAASKMQCITHC
jgi:hypothetical protein